MQYPDDDPHRREFRRAMRGKSRVVPCLFRGGADAGGEVLPGGKSIAVQPVSIECDRDSFDGRK